MDGTPIIKDAPDTKSESKEIVGTNVPEFFSALNGAASLALGYYWSPVEVWCNEDNKREFISVNASNSKTFKDTHPRWKRIVTVKPWPAGYSH